MAVPPVLIANLPSHKAERVSTIEKGELVLKMEIDRDILDMLLLDNTPEHTHKAIVQALQYLLEGVELELDKDEDFESWLIAEAIIRKNGR